MSFRVFLEVFNVICQKMKELSRSSAEYDAFNSTCNATVKATTAGRRKLQGWLNKNMKIEMTDGRILIGIFLCTDQGRNVILGSCSEYLKAGDEDEPRFLGLAMVPGHHIVSIHIDDPSSTNSASDVI